MASLIKTALIAGAALAALPGLAQAAWQKSYVVEWNEPAMYYGAKTGVTDPGTDCPTGTNPEIDWISVMTEAGYTREEAVWLRNPANPTRSPVHGQNQMAFRGKDRANVYIHPTSTPESGKFANVTGTIGEGLNLDGDARNGFTTPAGVTGVDNNFYKALGCWKTYRGPVRQSSGALSNNDSMREGSWTTVIVLTGKGKDPLNDNAVTVGFYVSPDKLVKDGNGAVARDYTFRVKPDLKYEAIFQAKTKDGVVTSTKAADKVMLRDPSYTRDLELLKARLDLQIGKDGSLKGFIGGYRPWQPVYTSYVNARGPIIESLTWVRLPDIYYALQRYADYSPTGPKGEKTHISFALRVDAVPAYVMTPDAQMQVAAVGSYKAQAKADPPRMATLFAGMQDGLVVGLEGQAVSQTKEQMTPPANRVASAATTAKN